jgi:hypothetical protein
MANRRSFKSDESFLEKISMGAVGTVTVLNDLKKQEHSPIELEGGSTSFKIWKNIKIKRIRVPDIVCIKCGKCVECRTKTRPEISMSHSRSDPERGWDYGLDGHDQVAFVICRKERDEPIGWASLGPVQYVLVEDLRQAVESGHTVLTEPKGAEEGFETRIVWPSSVASSSGVVTKVEKGLIQYKRADDGRTISLKLSKAGKRLIPLVEAGNSVRENQMLASVVATTTQFQCDKGVNIQDYIRLLSSPSTSKRYMATKTLGFFDLREEGESLVTRMDDSCEHVYIRLKAAVGLARQGDTRGYRFMDRFLRDEYLQNRLETVIVLGEINRPESCRMLINTLHDKNQDPEIRAGAAWSLGEIRDRAGIEALVESFGEVDTRIQVEAARALAKLARRFTPAIIAEFAKAKPADMPGISWALSKAGQFSVSDLLGLLTNDDARRWITYIIGTQGQDRYIHEIEQLRKKDTHVYFAVSVLWNVMASWIWGLEEY